MEKRRGIIVQNLWKEIAKEFMPDNLFKDAEERIFKDTIPEYEVEIKPDKAIIYVATEEDSKVAIMIENGHKSAKEVIQEGKPKDINKEEFSKHVILFDSSEQIEVMIKALNKSLEVAKRLENEK